MIVRFVLEAEFDSDEDANEWVESLPDNIDLIDEEVIEE